MIIRKAVEKDAISIVDININEWKNTYKNTFKDDFLNTLEDKRMESIEKCKNKISKYIVCEINNLVIGFLRYGPNKKGYSNNYGEVYALYIDSKYQKNGIGRKLLEYSFNILKNNYDYVLISTLKHNPANLFYKRCGGKLIDTCYFKIDNDKYEENIYLFEMCKDKQLNEYNLLGDTNAFK